MKFELKSKDSKSKARAGKITTDHGVIETPIFMPVGTVGTVKGVHQTELKDDSNINQLDWVGMVFINHLVLYCSIVVL